MARKLSPTPCRHLITPKAIAFYAFGVSHLVAGRWEAGNHFDRTDDMVIEFRELVSRNPKLLMDGTSDRVNGISLYEISIDLESCNVTSSVMLRVPIAGDLQSVFFIHYWIENGLVR